MLEVNATSTGTAAPHGPDERDDRRDPGLPQLPDSYGVVRTGTTAAEALMEDRPSLDFGKSSRTSEVGP